MTMLYIYILLVQGTGHFRITIQEGQDLIRALRGRVSGVCLPVYVLDIPYGFGKVPIGPSYVDFDPSGKTWVTDYKGTEHEYPPPNGGVV